MSEQLKKAFSFVHFLFFTVYLQETKLPTLWGHQNTRLPICFQSCVVSVFGDSGFCFRKPDMKSLKSFVHFLSLGGSMVLASAPASTFDIFISSVTESLQGGRERNKTEAATQNNISKGSWRRPEGFYSDPNEPYSAINMLPNSGKISKACCHSCMVCRGMTDIRKDQRIGQNLISNGTGANEHSHLWAGNDSQGVL